MEKTRANWHKSHWKRIHLYIRKKEIFYSENNLPRNMVESPSLEVFKT